MTHIYICTHSLWARGGTSNFAKTDAQNYHSKRRVEVTQTLAAEQERRKLFTKAKQQGSDEVVDGPTAESGQTMTHEPVAGLREGDIGEAAVPDVDEPQEAAVTPAQASFELFEIKVKGNLTSSSCIQIDHSRTLVIQPGSRYLRVGRSTDPTYVTLLDSDLNNLA